MNSLVICDDGDLAAGSAAARRLGVGLEVQQFHDPAVAEDTTALEGANVATAGLFPLAVHAPFGDLCAGSFDAMIRDATRHRFELGWAVADRLGAQHVVYHHGYVPGTSHPPNWTARSAKFWRVFLQGKPSAVCLHVENMLEHGPELLRDVLDAIDVPNMTACLDIGHAHCNSRATPLRWVEVLQKRIGYVHVHSNHGQSDEHLAPYEGTLDVAEVLRAINHHSPDAVWALEVPLKTIDQSMQWIRAAAEQT